jgi:hypothetical protein
LTYELYFFSEGTVFFSHNKSANNTFQLVFSAKRLQKYTVERLQIVQMLETTQNIDTCLHRSLQTKEARRVSVKKITQLMKA